MIAKPSLRAALVAVLLSAAGLVLTEPSLAQQPGSAPTPAAPHGFHGGAAPEDSSTPDENLPAQQVLVELLGAHGEPLPGIEVQLIAQFESIAQGKRSETKRASTNELGHALFSELDASLRFTYVVRIEKDGATTELGPFRVSEKFGQRVRLHIYPVTSDIREAFIGLRGFVLIGQRDDHFHIDVLYRVLNMSRVTWVPRDLRLSLPASFEALDVQSEQKTAGFSATERGVELVGTFPPGQRDVRFQFQVPTRGQSEESFTLSVPPHLAELRVLAESTPGMTLQVPGFEPAEPTRAPDGKKILITRKLMKPGQSELTDVRIELAGLPTPGISRIVACVIATLIAAGGLFIALKKRRGGDRELIQDRNRAREILLDELVAVEKAFRQEDIGPKTYEQTKKLLLEALARLEDKPLEARA